MSKKTLKFSAILSLLCFSLMAGAEEVKVSNAQEFVDAINNDKAAYIVLTADIDLGNKYFNLSSESAPFTGTIDGNGHTISNASYTTLVDDEYRALIPYASCAWIKDLTIDNFHINSNQTASLIKNIGKLALLVASSKDCFYKNITIRNSSVDYGTCYVEDLGGIVYQSYNDSFTDCTVEKSVTLNARSVSDMTLVGGIACVAEKTEFSRCFNAGTIFANGDYVGGIVAKATSCTIDCCLNTGTLTGLEPVGGIAGFATSTTSIQKCVNTGDIKLYDTGAVFVYTSARGGIVGEIESGSIYDCLSFGSIEEGNGCIDGKRTEKEVTYGSGNYYHCYMNGSMWDNTSEGGILDELTCGKYALNHSWLFQSLDNCAFSTTWPVPIHAAGKVYSNVLCNDSQTQTYSNYYKAEKGHTTNEFASVCSLCGNHLTVSPLPVTITNAEELCAIAHAVNSGVDYSNKTFILDNDIDMSGITDFVPIGKDADHSFRGYFLGHGHHIKNLNIRRTNGGRGMGVFGCVSGSTTIHDLVVDSSCSLSSPDYCVGGIVGYLTAKGDENVSSLTLYRCGNEAAVSGYANVGGLFGGVYDSDNAVVDIQDCYNTGAVTATKESAAIVGSGYKHLTVKRCWNTGKVTGHDDNAAMIRYYSADGDAKTEFSDNYQMMDLDADANATKKTAGEFAHGAVTYLLNIADTENNLTKFWGQNIGTDNTPQLTGEGIYHERGMSNTWGTVVLPFKIYNEGGKHLYMIESLYVSGNTGQLCLKPVDYVEANTPCFFKKQDDNATTVCFLQNYETFESPGDWNSLISCEAFDGWSLAGSYVNRTNLTDVYYLASGKFWHADEAISVPAYRAYLYFNNPNSNLAKCLSIVVNDGVTPTQIGEITADGQLNFFDQPVYNVAGQRVACNTHGIVIKNGHKYMVKE